jgi:hypothetical protein
VRYAVLAAVVTIGIIDARLEHDDRVAAYSRVYKVGFNDGVNATLKAIRTAGFNVERQAP